MTYDLVIKNVTVVDPAQGIHAKKDIAVAAGKIEAIEDYVSDSETRVLAFLHISGMGLISNDIGELEDIRWAQVEKAVKAAKLHSDVIVGIKVWLTDKIVGDNDLVALDRSIEAGVELDKPVMMHIGVCPLF